MSLQFYKRFRILPGVHLNVSLSGIGLSIGPKGAKVSKRVVGRRRRGQVNISPVLFGIRGTGIRWRSFF